MTGQVHHDDLFRFPPRQKIINGNTQIVHAFIGQFGDGESAESRIAEYPGEIGGILVRRPERP